MEIRYNQRMYLPFEVPDSSKTALVNLEETHAHLNEHTVQMMWPTEIGKVPQLIQCFSFEFTWN
jgi:hypothetical protein